MLPVRVWSHWSLSVNLSRMSRTTDQASNSRELRVRERVSLPSVTLRDMETPYVRPGPRTWKYRFSLSGVCSGFYSFTSSYILSERYCSITRVSATLLAVQSVLLYITDCLR